MERKLFNAEEHFILLPVWIIIYMGLLASPCVTQFIPAEIGTRPNRQYELAEESTVEMKCKPYGRPDPIVTWTFNREKLTDGPRHTIETGGTNEGMLTITDLTLEDNGVYNCNVTNVFGSEVVFPKLIVRKKTIISEGPGDQEVEEGKNALLKCEIESDEHLELTVRWSFNGNELNTDMDNGKYRLNSDNSILVIKAQQTDSGTFTCSAITTFSNANDSGTLTVLKKTIISEGPGDQEVEEGKNAVLKCEIESDEHLELTVRWSFNGNDLNTDMDNGKYRLNSDNSILVIKALQTDSGTFTCSAITTFSNASDSGTLTVLNLSDLSDLSVKDVSVACVANWIFTTTSIAVVMILLI